MEDPWGILAKCKHVSSENYCPGDVGTLFFEVEIQDNGTVIVTEVGPDHIICGGPACTLTVHEYQCPQEAIEELMKLEKCGC
jgi:hypothetical protein